MTGNKSNRPPKLVILGGAGGIGMAVALLLRELGETVLDIWLIDVDEVALHRAARQLESSSSLGRVDVLATKVSEANPALSAVLSEADLVLDCLPGSLATVAAKLALVHGCHYANLTEYVAETARISELARSASTCFALQCGLAPGFINILTMDLLSKFRREFEGASVDQVIMRVGALPVNALPPDFYGFTWSPEGVATEYIAPAVVLRDFKQQVRPSLSERGRLQVEGRVYEEALTSGGTADLPEALQGQVRELNYKTLRHPGHYDWVDSILAQIPGDHERGRQLQRRMEESISFVEEDEVVIYAAVIGQDARGRYHRRDCPLRIRPMQVAGVRLRAIQATTAASLAEVAHMQLTGEHSGRLTQSKIPTTKFLSGPFVSTVFFGQREWPAAHLRSTALPEDSPQYPYR